MHNHSYENEFNLHVNEISFSYEKMSTKTRFEEEAKGNSEMAYLKTQAFRCRVNGKHVLKGVFLKTLVSRSCDFSAHFFQTQILSVMVGF